MNQVRIRAGTLLVAALAALAPAVAVPYPANAAETCTDEFTGAPLAADVTGTDAAETFGPNEPAPRTLKSGDVVVAGGGRDTVIVTGLSGLTVCLGQGNDNLVGGAQAVLAPDGFGFSIRGGPGNDAIESTPYDDRVRGNDGTDSVVDASTADFDICREVESALHCEAVNPPF